VLREVADIIIHVWCACKLVCDTTVCLLATIAVSLGDVLLLRQHSRAGGDFIENACQLTQKLCTMNSFAALIHELATDVNAHSCMSVAFFLFGFFCCPSLMSCVS
jgi:hypothetical protein